VKAFARPFSIVLYVLRYSLFRFLLLVFQSVNESNKYIQAFDCYITVVVGVHD
jgi:hypothetical protein